MNEKTTFCVECRDDVEYTVEYIETESTIGGGTYTFMEKRAYCVNCGEEVYVHGIIDYNLKTLYDKFRESHNIISVEKISEIPEKYAIGKRPLSWLLGWEERTFTRYCDGDVPSKERSDILKMIYDDPSCFAKILEENKGKLKTEVSYNRSKKAVEALLSKIKKEEKAMYTVQNLIDRLKIEYKKGDKSGIYGRSQVLFGYNSNKIEGSKLTQEQTSFLFNTGYLPPSNTYYRAMDIAEMQGHFLMVGKMLDTLDYLLTEELIKEFHYCLKAGVFEDRVQGYAIGDYKKIANIVGGTATVQPTEVHSNMARLLNDFNSKDLTLEALADFHIQYEKIHPFQDGNGRTGRLLLFRECLRAGIQPFIILEENRSEYINAMAKGDIGLLVCLFEKAQKSFIEQAQYFWA